MLELKPLREIDDIPDGELFTEFVAFFGGERAMALLGWCATLALFGVWDPPAARKALEEKGLTKSAMYRALADLRRFGAYMEQKQSSPVTLQGLCVRLASFSRSSLA
jgi:hypothetical protein